MGLVGSHSEGFQQSVVALLAPNDRILQGARRDTVGQPPVAYTGIGNLERGDGRENSRFGPPENKKSTQENTVRTAYDLMAF